MKTREPTFIIRLEAVPVPKPRMTQRDRWYPSKRVSQFWGYADSLKWAAKSLILKPIGGPITLAIDFHMPFPRSYSKAKRRRLAGQPHICVPDVKNLLAGVEDAWNGIVWDDDAQIWRYRSVEKFWTDGPGLTVAYIWASEVEQTQDD